MTQLNGLVSKHIGILVGEAFSPNLSVKMEGDQSVNIFYKNMMIRITSDYRDGYVSSSITYTDDGDSEEIFTHIAARMFSGEIEEAPPSRATLEDNVIAELKELKSMISYIELNNLSGRDVRHFYLGYNTGYGHGRMSPLPS